jgi:hypothetical protein
MGLSISVGCAISSAEGGDLRDLLQVADRALYAAKGAGRNAVRMGSALLARSQLMPLSKGTDPSGGVRDGGLRPNVGE